MPADPQALLLARAQFAFTISFHTIFPALSIGLASYLAVLEALWLWTGKPIYLAVFRYWLKVFALVFAMGVVSGLVLSYEFGTNWSAFSDRAGPVIGPLMGYEVLTAFFLESGFLGIMLFGGERVGKRIHFLATCMVALGTLISAFWILSANSWMHTPQGHVMTPDGRFLPVDWWAIVFNPSFPYRFAHMTIASYLSVAFVVGAVAARHLLAEPKNLPARLMFSMAMWMAALVAPLQVLVGDLHGLNTFRHQPAKVAALEGHFETEAGAPFYIVGLPNMAAERIDYALSIPRAGSLILTHEWNGTVRGLKEWPAADRPNAPIVFWAFRLMLAIGGLMVLMGAWGALARWRGRLFDSPPLLRCMVAMGPSGLIAVLAGWIVTEVGRQPFLVYGLMRTAEGVSPVATPGVAVSFAAFIVVYAIVFGAGLTFILRLVAKPPEVDEAGPDPGHPVRSAGIKAPVGEARL